MTQDVQPRQDEIHVAACCGERARYDCVGFALVEENRVGLNMH